MAKNRKNSPNPLTKKGKMGRIKPIRKFFRERRGMVMGRRILAVLVALLALLWAAVPAYASSPAVTASQTAMPTLPLRWIKACAGR